MFQEKIDENKKRIERIEKMVVRLEDLKEFHKREIIYVSKEITDKIKMGIELKNQNCAIRKELEQAQKDLDKEEYATGGYNTQKKPKSQKALDKEAEKKFIDINYKISYEDLQEAISRRNRTIERMYIAIESLKVDLNNSKKEEKSS